jgi:excisionase family DNA binding protein
MSGSALQSISITGPEAAPSQSSGLGQSVESKRASRDRVESDATPAAYLTSRQVGELLQVNPRTVERWALEDASMPALRRGRTLRFPRAELERWLERSTQGSRKSRMAGGK